MEAFGQAIPAGEQPPGQTLPYAGPDATRFHEREQTSQRPVDAPMMPGLPPLIQSQNDERSGVPDLSFK